MSQPAMLPSMSVSWCLAQAFEIVPQGSRYEQTTWWFHKSIFIHRDFIQRTWDISPFYEPSTQHQDSLIGNFNPSQQTHQLINLDLDHLKLCGEYQDHDWNNWKKSPDDHGLNTHYIPLFLLVISPISQCFANFSGHQACLQQEIQLHHTLGISSLLGRENHGKNVWNSRIVLGLLMIFKLGYSINYHTSQSINCFGIVKFRIVKSSWDCWKFVAGLSNQ